MNPDIPGVREEIEWDFLPPARAADVDFLCDGSAELVTQDCIVNQPVEYCTASGSARSSSAPCPDQEGNFGSARSALRPTSCSPGQRALGLANTHSPASECEAVARLLSGIALGCMNFDSAVDASSINFGSRPTPTDESSLPELKLWIRGISRQVRDTIGHLYLTGVPKRAFVESDTDEGIATAFELSAPAGARAIELADLGTSIRTLGTAWNSISDNLELFANDIQGAELAIQDIREGNEIEHQKLDQSKAGGWLEIASAAASIYTAWPAVAGEVAGVRLEYISDLNRGEFKGITNAIASAVPQAAGGFIQANGASSIEAALDNNAETNVRIQLNQLNDRAIQRLGGVRDAFKGILDTLPIIDAKRAVVEQSQRNAKYALAKASGQDSVEVDGISVQLSSDLFATQREATRERYDTLVDEARVLAYLSRLSIEQRIGIRLNDIATSISTLDAPADWADEICGLSGHQPDEGFTLDLTEDDVSQSFLTPEQVDAFLQAMHEEFDLPATQEDPEDNTELVYIGDYVQRLQNFMTLYNVLFPSRDADDIALLSMRDNILVPDLNNCPVQSTNLLYFSDQLNSGISEISAEGQPQLSGWFTGACLEGSCLRVSPLVGVSTADGSGAASLLIDEEDTTPPPTVVGPEVPLAPLEEQTATAPARTTSQTVELASGAYVLTWWDQGWGPTGAPYQENDPVVEYLVTALDETDSALGSVSFLPQTSEWSARRELRFVVEHPGAVVIAIRASAELQTRGSVAIANVQLERLATEEQPASAYSPTGVTRIAYSGRCQSAESFRDQWVHRCEGSRCFHELRSPFSIDTTLLGTGFSTLEGQLAAGNVNYRHITTAINLVGTDVVQCESTPTVSCFANAQVEYDLVHQAFNAVLTDHNNQPRIFDFGEGRINHGKALAAERLITSPLGNADAELLAQPQFTKPELGGRPLSGTYQLRVYDSPAFKWDHLEDIQLIWNYRYWSRVHTQVDE